MTDQRYLCNVCRKPIIDHANFRGLSVIVEQKPPDMRLALERGVGVIGHAHFCPTCIPQLAQLIDDWKLQT